MTKQLYSHDFPSPVAKRATCGAPASEDRGGGTVDCPECLAIRQHKAPVVVPDRRRV